MNYSRRQRGVLRVSHAGALNGHHEVRDGGREVHGERVVTQRAHVFQKGYCAGAAVQEGRGSADQMIQLLFAWLCELLCPYAHTHIFLMTMRRSLLELLSRWL